MLWLINSLLLFITRKVFNIISTCFLKTRHDCTHCQSVRNGHVVQNWLWGWPSGVIFRGNSSCHWTQCDLIGSHSMDELKYSRAAGRMGLYLWTGKSVTEQLNIEHLMDEALMTSEPVWGLAWVLALIFMCCQAQRIANSSVTSHQIKPVLASVGSFKPWLIRAPLSSDLCISLLYWIFAVSFSLRAPLVSLSHWVLLSKSPVVGR